MAKQTFTALQVLTAAQQNALQANDYNQTVSTKTASYTLVAADVGTKIVMNSASATTITVNTSLFSAGDTLTILNIAAGVTTVTAGTATVSSAGSLALSQYASGTLYFTSAGVSVFQANGVAAAASGLVLISATTIGTTVSSVAVSSAFSATYDNYKITVSGGTVSSAGGGLGIQMGATTTGYYFALNRLTYANSQTNETGANVANWPSVGGKNTDGLGLSADLLSPFLAKNTFYYSNQVANATTSVAGGGGGYLADTTSYTAFTLIPSTGTLTGGTIRVYGYQNS